ncbi:MAG: hypothetical protein Q4D58_10315 [Synergistaceae bacterium]|nr:hypothetical protein [Synergistaceae bacterium]
MNGFKRLFQHCCVLGASVAALFFTPAAALLCDTKQPLGVSSLLCCCFHDAPHSCFVKMSYSAFLREHERLKKELEKSYQSCYDALDEEGRLELFESELLWEKMAEGYEMNLRRLDRPLLIYDDDMKGLMVTNVYREAITNILKWRADDLKRWRSGKPLPAHEKSVKDIKAGISAESRRCTELKSDARLLRRVLYNYDWIRTEKLSNRFVEKKLIFLEGRTCDERALLCERHESIRRKNRLLKMISAGLRGVSPFAGAQDKAGIRRFFQKRPAA